MVHALSRVLCALTTAPQVQRDLPRFKSFSSRIANISNRISNQIAIF